MDESCVWYGERWCQCVEFKYPYPVLSSYPFRAWLTKTDSFPRRGTRMIVKYLITIVQQKTKKKTFSEKMLRKEKKLSLAKVKTKVEFIHSWLIRFLLGVRFTDLTACRPSSIAVLYDHGNEALCITVQVSFNQSGRMPVLEEAMTSRFYCFARKSQKINARKYGLSKKLDSRFHPSISENFKASLSNVPWARVGNFWKSESIKSLSFWKGLRRSRRHFDRHRM